MEELQKSFEAKIQMRAAKKMSLELKITALQELVLQRFQALVAISSIAFAVAGILLSVRSDLIQNQALASFATILFVVIALAGLGRHLYLVRSDIKSISKKIKDLPDVDWSQPLEEKDFKADWWPETLYVLLVIGVLLFALALVC